MKAFVLHANFQKALIMKGELNNRLGKIAQPLLP
jgi:hypothetical protein